MFNPNFGFSGKVIDQRFQAKVKRGQLAKYFQRRRCLETKQAVKTASERSTTIFAGKGDTIDKNGRLKQASQRERLILDGAHDRL